MGDPLAQLSSAEVGTVLAIAAGLTAAWGALMPRLRTQAARRGIVSLELAWTADRARRIVDSWTGERMLPAAKRSLLLDMVFIVGYGATLAAAGVLAARTGAASRMLSDDHAEVVAALLAYGALVAALLDSVENVGLWLMLRRNVTTGLVVTTSLISSAKWLLIGLTAVSTAGTFVLSVALAVVDT